MKEVTEELTAERAQSLVAALAKRDDWLGESLAHVYLRDWQPTLRLLGGVLRQRTAQYIAALLRKNTEDLCCRPFAIAVAAALEAGREFFPRESLDRLVNQAIELYSARESWLPRRFVLGLMTTCGDHAIPNLVVRLLDEDELVRARAAKALGHLQAQQAVAQVAELLDDDDGLVRKAAATALGAIGTTEAIRLVLEGAKQNASVAEYAGAGMLRSFRPGDGAGQLVCHLEGMSERLELLGAWVAAKAGLGIPLPRLLQLLEIGDWDTQVFAAEVLGRNASADALLHLVERTMHPRGSVRWSTALALGCMETKEVIPHLHRLSGDEDHLVRKAAVEGLAWHARGEAVPTLRGWGGVIGSPQLVERIESPNETREIVDQLADSSPAVRKAALEAVSRSGCEGVVEWARGRLTDKEAPYRCRAALALGQIGSMQVVNDLLGLLQDDFAFVRDAAATAIEQVGRRHEMAIPARNAPEPIRTRVEALASALEALASVIEKAPMKIG
jgi:HEAT repeat protein